MNDPETNNIQNGENSAANAILNSEARDENADRIQGQTSQAADFTSMFGVQSEQTQEQKDMEKKSVVEIPRVLAPKEVKQEVVISAEEKKANHKKTFNNDEKLLYQIEPDKIGNPIVVLLFFAVLVGVIIALPKLSKKIDYSSFFKMTTNKKATEEEKKDDGFINIDSNASRAKIGNLEMINFVKSKHHNDYLLSFTIQNVGDRTYRFDKKYYVVFYSKGQVIYYALIYAYDAIGSGGALEVSLVISEPAYSLADQIRVEEVVESKYPDVHMAETEAEYQVMKCTYGYDEMTYYFLNGKLQKLHEVYTETSRDQEYEKDLYTFRNLTSKYKSLEHFSSNIIEDESGFVQITDIDLKKAVDNDVIGLQTYRFFKYNADKNVVSFELEAQGYKCG